MQDMLVDTFVYVATSRCLPHCISIIVLIAVTDASVLSLVK